MSHFISDINPICTVGGPYPPLNVPCGEKMTGLLPCENCFPKLATDGIVRERGRRGESGAESKHIALHNL